MTIITATDAIEMANDERDRIDEWPEERIQSKLEEFERARAVAGPEPELRADGSGGTKGEDADDDLPPLYIGDHVVDREDPDATMVVVGLDTLQADAYELGRDVTTVAEVNPEYPETDDVVEVVFPDRTDMDIDQKRYAYPRSRLERVASVHSEEVSD